MGKKTARVDNTMPIGTWARQNPFLGPGKLQCVDSCTFDIKIIFFPY